MSVSTGLIGQSASLGRTRWVVMTAIFVIAAVSYLDRNNISIAASAIQVEYGLSNVQLGAIFSAFALGYAAMQPAAGALADRFGAYRAIGLSLLWWSALTALTAMVPAKMAWSFALLIAVRLLLGVGESIIFPASNRLVAAWIPSQERGFANGLIFAGVGVGGAAAPPLITFIMLWLDWRWAFYICAAIGCVVALAWLLIGRERPHNHRWISKAELKYIEEGMPSDPRAGRMSWRDILSDRQVQLLTVSYFCFGYAAYIFFTWLFKYLSTVRGLDLKTSALYTALPFIAMALASSLGGLASDRLSARFGKRIGRGALAAFALGTAAFFIWSATRVASPQTAALILAGGAGSLYLSQSAYWAVSADMGAQSAGRLSSIMNMGAQVGGIVTASATPVLAEVYGWSASFSVAAALCGLGAVLWLFIDPEYLPRQSHRQPMVE